MVLAPGLKTNRGGSRITKIGGAGVETHAGPGRFGNMADPWVILIADREIGHQPDYRTKHTCDHGI